MLPARATIRSSAVICLIICLINLAVLAGSAGQSPQEPSAAALAEAIKTLINEAKQAKQDQQLPRTTADFARTFGREVPPEVLARRMARRAHADSFVDAYVRWQLTSFDPPLPDLDERTFERFLAQLPPLLHNPRADETLIESLGSAAREGQLSPRAQADVRRVLDGLGKRASLVQALNRPALELRDWIDKKLPEAGPPRLMVALERCGALVEAGWEASPAKLEVEQRFQAGGRDLTLTSRQRVRLAGQAERLAGRSRAYVSSAR
ncbi:MAG: hypothetical protein ACYSTY_06890, partial [Planctomycetota bacterium]